MFYWIYDIPNWSLALGMCAGDGGVCLCQCADLPTVRAQWLGPEPAANDLVSLLRSAFGRFLWLDAWSIAVGTYETFSRVEERVAE